MLSYYQLSVSIFIALYFSITLTSAAELINPTQPPQSPPETQQSQQQPQQQQQQQIPPQQVGFVNHPAYPYPIPYGDGYLYPATNQQPPQNGYAVGEQTYFSSMIPAAQAALQVALRLFAKVGLFLIGGVALLVVGGIFTTAVCSLTPICTITFNGVGLKGIDREQMRAMMTPEKISAAAALVQDAIGKYQRLQRAVGSR